MIKPCSRNMMPQRQSSRSAAPSAKVRAAALALAALQREADSQPAVSLVAAGDAHAAKVGLLPGFKQSQQLYRSGEGCDDEGSADGDSGDVDVASGDGDVVALTPQEVERTKKKPARCRHRGAWNTRNDLVLCGFGEHVFRLDVKQVVWRLEGWSALAVPTAVRCLRYCFLRQSACRAAWLGRESSKESNMVLVYLYNSNKRTFKKERPFLKTSRNKPP